MITTYPIQIIRFIVLVLIQILFANNIFLNFGDYVNIYVYHLFIMLLPVSISWWALLITSFFIGLSVDMFTNTLGLHASACLFIAFFRPNILDLLSPRDGYDFNSELNSRDLGLKWFVYYAFIMTFIHNFWLFYLEAFQFVDILRIFGKVLFSTLISVLVLYVFQYITIKPKK